MRPSAICSSTFTAVRRATSSQIGWPEGASAACSTVSPSPSATTCALAAVPKNWQPPPGEAHARQPSSAASCSVTMPCEKRAPSVCTAPASSPTVGGSVTPPGTIAPGSPRNDATAISMAGRPLSQVPMPITALRRGRLRTSRRSTIAASLRYGSESYMPDVPWLRPSHGSET